MLFVKVGGVLGKLDIDVVCKLRETFFLANTFLNTGLDNFIRKALDSPYLTNNTPPI